VTSAAEPPVVTPASEADAYRLFEQRRWGPQPPACPHCAAPGRCYFLRPADGLARRTRGGHRSQRRVWKCGVCRRQFSVLTGTVFQGTRIELRTWLRVLNAYGADVPPARELVTRFGMSRDGARHVVARLAAATAVRGPDNAGRLEGLLRIPAEQAARVRAQTPGRARSRRQFGPTADYGGD
jgi:hypothetical protein